MEHRARYEALVEFLLPYQDIWRNEIMLSYPHSLKGHPPEWIEALRPHIGAAPTHELLLGRGWERLGAGLAEFHNQLTELVRFEHSTPHSPIPTKPHSWVHIIPKKQHELEMIVPLIADRMQNYAHLIDIGGGQGHLAQTLAHHYGFEVLSLDMDPELQTIGERWQQVKWAASPHRVRFKAHKIARRDAVFAALMSSKTLTTGLHTCGALGVAHLEAAVLARAGVWNMPCCYQKLTAQDCNLSAVAKKNPLPLEQFALTLAAGAYHKASLADCVFREKIKRKRYILHFLLHDHLNTPGLVRLGNCPPALYDGEFAPYAREQLKRLDLTISWSDAELNRYAQTPELQKLIDDMLAAGIVREMFCRALEVAILTDRALWLEEQGYEVTIEQVFDAHVSPRNLVVFARPRTSSRS